MSKSLVDSAPFINMADCHLPFKKRITLSQKNVSNSDVDDNTNLNHLPKAKKWQICRNQVKKNLHFRGSRMPPADSIQLDDKGMILCGQCGKALKSKGILLTHMERFHSEERAYGCTFCQRKFKTNGDLKVHFNSAHVTFEEKYCFQCSYCCKTFNRKFYKERHEKDGCSLGKAIREAAAKENIGSDEPNAPKPTSSDPALIVGTSKIHGKGLFAD